MKLTPNRRFSTAKPMPFVDGPIMMKPAILASATLLALSACAEAPEDTTATTSEAEAFAQRINGDLNLQDAPQPTAADPMPAPTVAPPRESVSTNPFAAGTATDPNSACNANAFGQFIGRQPNADTRAEIMAAASNLPEVRFIAPGGDYIKPDPTNPRLNIMIAVDGIIRDIRCG